MPNGIDLSNSIENEFYCLKLLEAFGLPVNAAEIITFGDTKALVIERFDRRWTKDGRLLRLAAGGLLPGPCRSRRRANIRATADPGMVAILDLLKGSDDPAEDQKSFLKAQLLFWLIGATDGHGKNFSIYLGPGGTYRLTPFYDVLTAQPSLDDRRIERKQMKLAMSVGKSRHYRVDTIQARHFVQTRRGGGGAEGARARGAGGGRQRTPNGRWRGRKTRFRRGFRRRSTRRSLRVCGGGCGVWQSQRGTEEIGRSFPQLRGKDKLPTV